MPNYIVAPEADKDLIEIWKYLSIKGSPEVADRVEDELYSAFARLAATPGIGHTRTDLTSYPVLFFTVYSYMVVYTTSQPLEIVRVVHGRRDLKRLLR